MSGFKKFNFAWNLNRIIKNEFFWLFFIVLVGLTVRFFRIDLSPPRLTHDEMSIGYNAFSILKTAKDEWGRLFPLDFEAFGDHKLPGYIYALVPILKFLPLNLVTVKIPSILLGLLAIVGSFFLAKLLTQNKFISLLVALLFALSPWSIHLSRMALESNLAMAIFIWGLYCLILALEQKSNNFKYLILSGLFLGLTNYFYVAYRLITLLVLLAMWLFSFIYKIEKKKIILITIFFGLTILPLAKEMLGNSGSARFNQVSIFSDKGVEATILEQHNFCFLSQPRVLPKLCRIIYNKPFLYLENFSKKYLEFLFPTFLFINGDQLTYLGDNSVAELYLFLAIFYLFGIVSWFKQSGLKENFIKIAYLLAPIPSALVGDPQIVRGSALLFFVIFFVAVGIFEVYQTLKDNLQKWVFSFVLLSIFVVVTLRFLVSYFYIYPAKQATAFYPLSEKIAQFLLEKETSYDLIYVDKKTFTDAHIFIAFYKKLDPTWYQHNVIRPEKDGFGFSHPTQLGKYQFGDELIDNFICNQTDKRKILYVTNNLELVPQWLFKDFSNVHKEAQIYDVAQTRDSLITNKLFTKMCH